MSELPDAQRIDRARRASQALDEFLAPAIALIEADYGEKMIAAAASTDPRSTEIITRLAQGIKVARQVKSLIEAYVTDGKAVEAERERKARLEEMNPSQRRLLNVAPH